MRMIRLFYAILLLGAASMVASDEPFEEGEEDVEPSYAVLFPWFVEAVGIFVFFMLTRYMHGLPYTAVMFLVGIIMGIGITESGLTDQLTISITQWAGINSEVLLLIFLPGLIFRDAIQINFYLFTKALGQILLLAFPMVLAGTALTAVFAKYVFPYDWSFNFAMTFGSILSATDPVAVAALMNDVGAPPRLKMHIGGESMFNDGSAMVFYTIFSALYLNEQGLPGGDDVDLAQGVAIFCRMALGGAAIGIAFGLGLLCLLSLLNRRLDNEENVLQVAATVAVAYLSFYTADQSTEMSGVISVVCCGITTSAFGNGIINNPDMMESFWILVEHLLNTLLFALGGVVWGTVIVRSGDKGNVWEGRDWGYLFLLYIYLTALRAVLVAAFYPFMRKLGLGTNRQEAIFSWWGGLRGAVGIALSISIDNAVWSATDDPVAREDTSKLFGMVGGIAFLTLCINGTTAGPILFKLGLADSTEMRKRVVKCFEGGLRNHILDVFVDRMTDKRFCHSDFALVRYHVPTLQNLTIAELTDAVERRRDEMNPKHYTAPNLGHVLPYLFDPNASQDERDVISASFVERSVLEDEHGQPTPEAGDRPGEEGKDLSTADGSPDAIEQAFELRLVFIELIRAAYTEGVNRGEVDPRQYDGLLVNSLMDSLDFASDEASRGGPLNDWEHSQVNLNQLVEGSKNKLALGRSKAGRGWRGEVADLLNLEKVQMRLDVSRSITFIYAHRIAARNFRVHFTDKGIPLLQSQQTVLEENEGEIRKAEDLLGSFETDIVRSILSHMLCNDLLNSGAKYVETLLESGLLKQREGREYLETIEKNLKHIAQCGLEEHPGEYSEQEREGIIKTLGTSLEEESLGLGDQPVHAVGHAVSHADLRHRKSSVPGHLL